MGGQRAPKRAELASGSKRQGSFRSPVLGSQKLLSRAETKFSCREERVMGTKSGVKEGLKKPDSFDGSRLEGRKAPE